MRFQRLTLVVALSAVAGAARSENAKSLLELAVDADSPAYVKKYAHSRLRMLADESASVFFPHVEKGGPKGALSARLLGGASSGAGEAVLLAAAFGDDRLVAPAAVESLARLHSRKSDRELFRLLRYGGPEPGETRLPGEAEDWLELTLRDAASRSRFRAIVMHGLYLRHARLDAGGAPAPMPDSLTRKIWECLGDSDPELRLWSARAAGVSGSDLAPERLASFLYFESVPRLLIAGLRVMAGLRPPGHGGAVERHVRHDDPMVALEALATLDALGYEYAMFPPAPGQGYRCVAAFVRHPSTAVRLRALEILAGVADPRSEDYVVAALGDLSGPVRILAARIAGEKRFPNAAGELTILLNDSWPAVRGEAARALSRLGVVGVAPRMLDDLEQGDPEQRREAAGALGDIGDARAVRYLLAALAAGDPELAATVLEALGKLGDRSAGEKIYALMRSTDDPALADAARRALFLLFGDDPGDSNPNREAWARRNLPEAGR
ncbi:MAG: HEAT repeat domain-containing protein [Planctomycetota bacterium]|jgi:hypothetical protein|nr:HEAT repeat domain-containing protein [Planctomycetota bacterium]